MTVAISAHSFSASLMASSATCDDILGAGVLESSETMRSTEGLLSCVSGTPVRGEDDPRCSPGAPSCTPLPWPGCCSASSWCTEGRR